MHLRRYFIFYLYSKDIKEINVLNNLFATNRISSNIYYNKSIIQGVPTALATFQRVITYENQ